MGNGRSLARTGRARFYQSGLGDRLVDELHYPPEILEFLSAEKRLLAVLRPVFGTLVEVGCMDGRHLAWAVGNKKAYLGVEPVPRYATAGQQAIEQWSLDPLRYRIIRGSAESLDVVLKQEVAPCDQSLIFFPFNSFGNAREPSVIFRALARVGRPLVISSYRTTKTATSVRRDYYERCSYQRLRKEESRAGTRFVTDDGLNSMAYRTGYLARLAAECGLDLIPVPFGRIGLAFAAGAAATVLRPASHRARRA